MPTTTISPNMLLPVPTVAQDPGPDWATNIDACLNAIDSHNHSVNQGVQITPSGLNINSDLAINSNNLTTARSVRFATQATPLALAADLGCLYESGVDLYFNDGAGNQIRITQSGSVSGSAGTITGLPSGTASASFAGSTFTWQSATSTPASMAQGPTKIAQAVASGFGVTISASGSQVANYAMALPVALPAATSVVTMDSSGNLLVATPIVQTTYVPVFSSAVNCTVNTVNTFQYSRVGNAVTVWGNADITFTAASTFTTMLMTVPVNRSTNFSDNNVGGTAQAVDNGGLITMGVRGGGSTTSQVLVEGTTFAGETGIRNTRFHFTYMLG